MSWFYEHRSHETDLARLNALQGEHDKLQQVHAAQERILNRSGLIWTQSRGKWYIVNNPAPLDMSDEAAIMKVLKEENEVQRRLIEKMQAERQEVRDTSGPES